MKHNTRIVFVASFSPSVVTDDTGTGGFDWRETKWDATDLLSSEHFVHDPERGGHDYMLRAVRVPGDLTGEELTHWLDERPELWDVPAVPADPQEILRSYEGGEFGQWNMTDGDQLQGTVVHNDPERGYFVIEVEPWGGAVADPDFKFRTVEYGRVDLTEED